MSVSFKTVLNTTNYQTKVSAIVEALFVTFTSLKSVTFCTLLVAEHPCAISAQTALLAKKALMYRFTNCGCSCCTQWLQLGM